MLWLKYGRNIPWGLVAITTQTPIPSLVFGFVHPAALRKKIQDNKNYNKSFMKQLLPTSRHIHLLSINNACTDVTSASECTYCTTFHFRISLFRIIFVFCTGGGKCLRLSGHLLVHILIVLAAIWSC